MQTAWSHRKDGEYEYDLPKLCCRKLMKSYDFQFQDNKWLVFGNDMKAIPSTIFYCPFCGKKLKKYPFTLQEKSKDG